MSAVSHIDSHELERLRGEAGLTLIDVRTDAEVARGMIAGARHIPLNTLPVRHVELDSAAVTVFYCQSGARSAQACMFLADKGFARLYNLQGGVLGWLRDGQLLVVPE